MQLTEQATEIFNQTLTHVDPSKIMPETVQWNEDSGELTVEGKHFNIHKDQPIYVIGAGKASVSMALGIESILHGRIKDGIVISPDAFEGDSKIQVFVGSHPLPDKESISSSYELVSFIKKIPKNSFVINLISGGTSSLFCLPAGNLEIEEIRDIYSLLIESGADIHEINSVRKVFSAVKGGQILQHLKGKQVVDLMISDITDDEIGMIGSGPSIAQEISATEAFQILKQYKLYNSIPHAARQFLASEMDKEMKMKTYRNTKEIDRHSSFIIASASTMASKAADIAKEMGFDVTLNDKAVSGPMNQLEQSLLTQIRDLIKDNDGQKAIISFGEPTVQVTGDGLGGRNQELALRMAVSLQNIDRDLAFLSAGTDGIDGPTDVAGAVVTNETYRMALESDINPKQYLDNNDSYHFFKKAGGHIKPGPTGNNLMDLHIVLIG
ncbi:glycerate kinase type-2 family protein [Rhodohalobacter sp. 8-1]|uniref:glycerate kinase type-2 family protein n=1 Tax=Rhodohalobacter sp. 8-1 TaxID=3131972 RepID=UPI0030EC0803